MKKYAKVLISLVLTGVLFLFACGNGETSTSNPLEDGNDSEAASPSSNEDIEINLWHFDPGERMDIYQKAVDRFEEKHENVTVNVLQIPNDEYKQRVVVSMSGNNAPDVFASWGGGWLEEFVESGQVMDLTESGIDIERFVDVALENGTIDDKVYGLPLGISVYNFFYNTEIFAEHGLEEPETYEDLLNIIETLNAADIYPIALANQPMWPGAFYMMYFADRLGGEELFQEANGRTGRGFDDAAFIEAGKHIQELVEMEAFNPGANGLPYDAGSARQLLYSDQAAMMLMTGGFVNNVRDEYPEFEDKMGVFQFPALGEGDPSNLAAGVSPTWSVKAETEHPELVIELLDTLTDLETAQDYVNRSGNVVAIKGVDVEDPYVSIFSEWVNEANSIQFPYDQTLTPELAEVHLNTTFDLFGLSTTPEAAAEAMENKAVEIENE